MADYWRSVNLYGLSEGDPGRMAPAKQKVACKATVSEPIIVRRSGVAEYVPHNHKPWKLSLATLMERVIMLCVARLTTRA